MHDPCEDVASNLQPTKCQCLQTIPEYPYINTIIPGYPYTNTIITARLSCMLFWEGEKSETTGVLKSTAMISIQPRSFMP